LYLIYVSDDHTRANGVADGSVEDHLS